MGNGHLFVVEGSIGMLVADATILPTDKEFNLESYWHRVASPEEEYEQGRFEPDDWKAKQWGRSRDASSTWFIDVADDPSRSPHRFHRLRAALHDIATSEIKPKVRGRQYPLVVLPVLGTRGGGFGHLRGESIRQLIDACLDFEPGPTTIDVAIVAQNPASYGALQEQRRQSARDFFEGTNLVAAERIGALAQSGQLALFIGAGASVPAGAPLWKELIAQLAAKARLKPEVSARLGSLDALDQAELLAGALGGDDQLASAIRSAINVKQPALAHSLLATLRCQAAITTNYDPLYEIAVRARAAEIAVLPGERPSAGEQWVLKLHGDLRSPRTIVLTRGQFVQFTAISGPSGAVLQTTLLTKHLLVVGTSMSDPNVLRLIQEVAQYRRLHRGSVQHESERDVFGTILDISANPARRQLHESHFDWLEMPGADDVRRARELEIFLDAVAMYAASDSSWLLDPNYSALLDEQDERLVKSARALYNEIVSADRHDGAWGAMREFLAAHGARSTTSQAGALSE